MRGAVSPRKSRFLGEERWFPADEVMAKGASMAGETVTNGA